MANAEPGTDTVEFSPFPRNTNGPTTGPITLSAPLIITSPLFVKGNGNCGQTADPLRPEITAPSDAQPFDGLVFDTGSDGSTIAAASVTNFANGIVLASNNNLVRDNWIGLRPDGTTGGQRRRCVHHRLHHTVGPRNVIAGNNSEGIDLDIADTTTVEENFIGTNPAGAAGLGNGGDRIRLPGGSGSTLTGNVIANNGFGGIFATSAFVGEMVTPARDVTIQGNSIGVVGDVPPSAMVATASG